MRPFHQKNEWISSLCSFVLHLAVLLILAIWTIASNGNGERFNIISTGEDGVSNLVDLNIDPSSDAQAEELQSSSALGPQLSTSAILSSSDPAEMSLTEPSLQTEALTPQLEISASGEASKTGASGFVETAISDRSSTQRLKSSESRGASKESEQAVEAALQYLARHQHNNGSWNMALQICNGSCTDVCGSLDNHEIAGTGLALLCFLGAGHSPHSGEYSETVSKGTYFLIQNLQLRQKSGGDEGYWLDETATAQMYEHGIATLALCEALQLTGDTSLREPCQSAVNFICNAQFKGGWNYHPAQPGDLSIAAWQMMALKSAAAAKLNVPTYVIRANDEFLRANGNGEYLFSYRRGKPTPSMTAIGNLIRLFRGWSVTDPAILRASDYLAGKGPSGEDVYSNYYATQFMYHVGGRNWKNWNGIMREMLIHSQSRDGHMAGSWYFGGNQFNKDAGRLYVTTMCCLTLEVYYRYLPVYEQSTNEFRL